MKNVVVIFAGGVGSRMKDAAIPKQFLEIDGVPIIVHTIKKFQSCDEIDAISIACKGEYIPYLNELVVKYDLNKVLWVVEGGSTGQLSIFNGLEAIYESKLVSSNAVVLIHDGVRPIIDSQLIIENINTTRKKGNAITVCKAIETIFSSNDSGQMEAILEREKLYHAKAPQTFVLKDLYQTHLKEMRKGNINNIDSCSMMHNAGFNLNFVMGKSSNIKITTYEDYCVCKALFELEKNANEGELRYE